MRPHVPFALAALVLLAAPLASPAHAQVVDDRDKLAQTAMKFLAVGADPRSAALGDATRLSLIDRLAGAPFLTTTALVLALVPFIPRFPVLFILDRKTTPRRDALIAWSLVPRGLAAAVLAQYAVGKGVPHAEGLAQVVNLMVFLSITAVAVSVFLIERGKLDSLGQVALTWFPDSLAEPIETPEEEAPNAEGTATPGEPVAALDAPAPPSPPEPEPAETPTENPSGEALQTVTVDLRPAPGPDAPDEGL